MAHNPCRVRVPPAPHQSPSKSGYLSKAFDRKAEAQNQPGSDKLNSQSFSVVEYQGAHIPAEWLLQLPACCAAAPGTAVIRHCPGSGARLTRSRLQGAAAAVRPRSPPRQPYRHQRRCTILIRIVIPSSTSYVSIADLRRIPESSSNASMSSSLPPILDLPLPGRSGSSPWPRTAHEQELDVPPKPLRRDAGHRKRLIVSSSCHQAVSDHQRETAYAGADSEPDRPRGP